MAGYFLLKVLPRQGDGESPGLNYICDTAVGVSFYIPTTIPYSHIDHYCALARAAPGRPGVDIVDILQNKIRWQARLLYKESSLPDEPVQGA